MPLMPPKSNFDIDLKFGQFAEMWAQDVLERGNGVEVKCERDIWLSSDCLAFEFSYKGKPSGIMATQARWWCHVFSERGAIKGAFIFDVNSLRKALLALHKSGSLEVVKGGDCGNSELWLVPARLAGELLKG